MNDKNIYLSAEEMLNKRLLHTYDLKDEAIIKNDKDIILLEFKQLELKGKLQIFENQEEISYKILTHFKNKKITNIMIISKTQSGKTGSMCATIKNYLNDPYNIIPIENIYIITGLSSIEWKEQTKDRMPNSIHNRVFHRYDLPSSFVDEIKSKHNILIIMDEIQVAAKQKQTIHTAFKEAGLFNSDNLYKKDIKIIEYSATPDGTIYDLKKWKESSIIELANAGEGYVSSYDLLSKGRVKQFKDLCGYNIKTKKQDTNVLNNIREIRDDIIKYYNNNQLYHIIRTNTGYSQDVTINNFKKIFNKDEFDFITYDKDSDIDDINNILYIKPQKHTFIFIKEMLRCAKTLTKTYLGISYERYTKNPDDTAIIQGLVGRDTGYDNNGISRHYTNIDSIKKYEKLWISKFEDKSIKWNSKTTKFKNGNICAKKTFNDPKGYNNTSEDSDDDTNNTIPVKIVFNDNKLLQIVLQIIDKPNRSKDDKEKLNNLLQTGISNNKITVYDKNTKQFDITIRTINQVRMYKNGDSIDARRFKNFNEAFETDKKVSQSCNKSQYNIDFAKDEYKQGDFVNTINTAWITYKY
jgi:hypothetical protein